MGYVLVWVGYHTHHNQHTQHNNTQKMEEMIGVQKNPVQIIMDWI